MNVIARAFLALLLGLSFAAAAQQAAPATAPATDAPAMPAATAPHYDPRGTTQSVCVAPAIGSCGSCSASCTTGQFALCTPGVAMTPPAGSACVQAPVCKCR